MFIEKLKFGYCEPPFNIGEKTTTIELSKRMNVFFRSSEFDTTKRFSPFNPTTTLTDVALTVMTDMFIHLGISIEALLSAEEVRKTAYARPKHPYRFNVGKISDILSHRTIKNANYFLQDRADISENILSSCDVDYTGGIKSLPVVSFYSMRDISTIKYEDIFELVKSSDPMNGYLDVYKHEGGNFKQLMWMKDLIAKDRKNLPNPLTRLIKFFNYVHPAAGLVDICVYGNLSEYSIYDPKSSQYDTTWYWKLTFTGNRAIDSYSPSVLPKSHLSTFFLGLDLAYRTYHLDIAKGGDGNGECSGVVFIDEVEVGYTPKTQRLLLSALTQCYPKVQFLVTTNSPIILQSVEEDWRMFDEGLSYKETHIREHSLDEIMGSVFGVANPTRSQKWHEMKETAIRYYKIADEAANETDREKLKEVKARLDRLLIPYTNDPAYAAWLELYGMGKGVLVQTQKRHLNPPHQQGNQTA